MAKAPRVPTKFTPTMLKAWRARMGYDQREACQQLGCSRGAYQGWEKNEGRPPRYIGLACAALALGMTAYGAAVPGPAKEGMGK